MSRSQSIFKKLSRSVPDYSTELNYNNPFELLIATILSAQCTDERVNQTTPGLFAEYPDARSLAQADPARVEELIHSTGTFRAKTRSIMKCSQALVDDHDGQVPRDFKALVKLTGVGRKTANLLCGELFDMPAVVVDTHVKRVARRLELSRSAKPEEIEVDLQGHWPQKHWYAASSRLLLHGRRVCKARKPNCQECVLAELCHSEDRLVAT